MKFEKKLSYIDGEDTSLLKIISIFFKLTVCKERENMNIMVSIKLKRQPFRIRGVKELVSRI